MPVPDIDFARRFRSLCIESDLPTGHVELGKALGVSSVMAGNYLRGDKLPGMPNAIRFAKIMGVCVEFLLTGRGPKYPHGSEVTLGDQLDMSGLTDEAKVALRVFLHSLDEPNRKVSNHDD